MAPKTRKTKKNTAPQGVAPTGKRNENYLFPGITSEVQQPRQITWPQLGSNPADRGYLEPYDPFTGMPTGQPPINPYIPQFQPYSMYGPPVGPTTTPATATPTTPGTIDNSNPEMRYFNPYLQTAPTGSTGGIPPQAPLPEGYQYPYWLEEREGRPAYMWEKNEETGQIELVANEDAFPGAPVPELDVNGNPWTSVYSKDFYSTQEKNPLQWLAGSSNGGNMGSRGWRRPGRYYIPDQQVTRAGPNGPITAERPKPPPRRGETPNPEGNNKNLTIPAWVGSLVSWRT